MQLQKCFKFTGEEYFFEGHFPEMPILPGVAQLKLAHEAAEEMVGVKRVLKEVKKVKFVKIIRPCDHVRLELDGDSEVTYRFYKGEELCSSGVLVY